MTQQMTLILILSVIKASIHMPVASVPPSAVLTRLNCDFQNQYHFKSPTNKPKTNQSVYRNTHFTLALVLFTYDLVGYHKAVVAGRSALMMYKQQNELLSGYWKNLFLDL